MGLIRWGIALIVIGILVSLLLPGEPGDPVLSLGWVLVLAGIVLAIASLFVGRRQRPAV